MEKTDKEVLELCKSWFEDIMERSERLTSGNVSHGSRAIYGNAKNYVEYINEHIKTMWKPTDDEMNALRVAIGDEQNSDICKHLRSLYAKLKSL